MTQAQTQRHDVRRHPNGSIDLDFYRTRATALRGHAKRDAATSKAVCAFVLTMVSALAVGVLLAAAPLHAQNGHATVAQAKTAPIR